MALNAHSEKADLSLPDDYRRDHPGEHPEMWGWHAEWGRAAGGGGFVVMALLLLMITSTQYNFAGAIWLIGIAVGILVVMIWDRQRRKHQYR
ncbi:MAG: DUF2631 domain-containing protein [Jatrophihabitans sp.]|nr:MAG: DUF2631 domain-containing protein [Jatrophihabitans sp.]